MSAGANQGRDYSAFGLTVRSELVLPELFEVPAFEVPDVRICRGTVSTTQDAPGLHGSGDSLLLVVTDVARYSIVGGRQITVDAEPGAPAENVRLFLLGSAFGALLLQRGLLPLHANAITMNGTAVAFMGQSGVGKSTLAAWFLDRGFKILSDDVCVIKLDDSGQAWAAPGLPRLRLWAEALAHSGRDVDRYPRSYAGDEAYDKFDVPIDRAAAPEEAVPLRAIYLLEHGDRFSIGRISGLEAAEALFAHTYRGEYLAVAGRQEAHWLSSISLVRSTPLFRVTRDWGLDKMEDQNVRLLEHTQIHASG